MQTHNGYPAVNVKVHGQFGPSVGEIAERFGCSEEQGGKALEFARESAQQSFWDYWQDDSPYSPIKAGNDFPGYFPGYTVEIVCEGRSGGWLEVHGLPEWVDDSETGSDNPDAPEHFRLAQWEAFEADVLADVAYRCSPEAVIEDIDANEWWREGSELYNFSDAHPGRTVAEWNAVKDAAVKAAWEGFTSTGGTLGRILPNA